MSGAAKPGAGPARDTGASACGSAPGPTTRTTAPRVPTARPDRSGASSAATTPRRTLEYKANSTASAVPATGRRTGSILATEGSGLGRRHSVQFSADTPLSTPSARAQSTAARAAARGDADFRQNMVDFLGVMYGDKAEGGGAATATATATATAGTAPPIPTTAPRARASMYRNAVAAPQAQPVSPDGNAGARKGPQIRGNTTATAVPIGARATGGSSGGDGIDKLVDHLVRAYSSRMGAGNERGLGIDDGGEVPISYIGGRRRGPITARRGANEAEVNDFVSQALDSFLGPIGSSRNANQLQSAKSILSTIGMDENFANLLSFKTHSNLPSGGVDSEESAQLQPMYIGEQAMFRSVQGNDVSISKSMGVMRGVIPPATGDGGADSGRANRAAGKPPVARASARVAVDLEKSLDSDRAGGAALNCDKSFTLDSRALAGGEDSDDSWANVDAEATKLTKQEREKQARKAAAERGGANMGRSSGALVNSTRSLLGLAKVRTAIVELVEEEALSRNVVAALEQQLRGYFAAAHRDSKGAPTVRGRRKTSTEDSPPPAQVAPRRTSLQRTPVSK